MKFALLILALISSIPLLPAQVIEPPLEAKTFRDGDFELNYRIHVPADLKPDEKVPLILILHGAGERGSENLNQLRHGVPALLRLPQLSFFQAQANSSVSYYDRGKNADQRAAGMEPDGLDAGFMLGPNISASGGLR